MNFKSSIMAPKTILKIAILLGPVSIIVNDMLRKCLFVSSYVFGADFRPMAQDNHILFSQVFETVLKPLPKYDVDIVCRDTPSVKEH